MINRCLGSGANGIGYYMYHAGSTPKGKDGFMNDEAFGLPKISYEYQSPIGEFGQVREGFHRLKLIHFFLNDFGSLLAPMTVVLPANASKVTPANTHDLRYAARVNGSSGFLFLNDFQDDTTMVDQNNVCVKIETAKGDVIIPEKGGFNLKSGENVIFPFNFDMNGAHLNYATAQLLMKGDNTHPYFVFFTPEGTNGEFSFAGGTRVENVQGTSIDASHQRTLVKCRDKISEFSVIVNNTKTNVLVINKDLALKSYVVTLNGIKSLMFSDAVVLQNGDSFELLSDSASRFAIDVYPKTAAAPKTSFGTVTKMEGNSLFASYTFSLPAFTLGAKTNVVSTKKVAVDLPKTLPSDVNDIYLTANYIGDTGMDFFNGELVDDNFYNGIPWQVGLRKFITNPAKPGQMVFYFRPMHKNATYLLDLEPYPQYIPDFGKSQSYIKVQGFTFTPQYKTTITF
jgi:hypothetical protein